MGKSFNEYTTLKQGIVVGLFIFVSIFGGDIRSVAGGSDEVEGIRDRLTKVEVENEAHPIFTEQIDASTDLIHEVQRLQGKIATQVENLTTIVNAMQAREYERLGSGNNP